MSYDKKPLTTLIAALKLEEAVPVENHREDQILVKSMLAGVIDVTIHIHDSGRLYIRALDLTNPHEWPTDLAKDPGSIVNNSDIQHWIKRFGHHNVGTQLGNEMLQKYRDIVGDQEAQVWAFPRIPGVTKKYGRATTTFIALEIIPYLLYFLELTSPRIPEHQPAWNLLMAVAPFPDVPLEAIGVKTVQKSTEDLIKAGGTREETIIGKEPGKRNKRRVPIDDIIPDLFLEVAQPAPSLETMIDMYKKEHDELVALKVQHEALKKEKAVKLGAMEIGQEGEQHVLQLIKKNIRPHCRVRGLAQWAGHGDFMITYRDKKSEEIIGYAIIDVKNIETQVAGLEVDKLERDIEVCYRETGSYPLWAALISLKSTVGHNGEEGRSYDYHMVPVFILPQAGASVDGGNNVVRLILDMGDLLVGSRRLDKDQDMSLSASRILKIETDQKPATIPVLLPHVSTRTKASAVRPIVASQASDDPSDPCPADITHLQAAKRPIKLDLRIFKEIPEDKTRLYWQAAQLSRIVRYKENSVIWAADVCKKLAPILGITDKEVRKLLNVMCREENIDRRRFLNVTYRLTSS
jgi:hypothetical protein